MKISFIIPVYNVENYLQKCVESILKQNCDKEIILVDDGSTDGSGKICDDYAEKYPESITVLHKENGGLSSARNAGLEKASGDYVLFFNAGDTFCSEDVLENAMKVISENADYDFVFGWSKCIDKNAVCTRTDKYDNYKNKTFFADNNICHQAIFYKRSLFSNDKYDTQNFKIYADWDFNVRCVKLKKAKILPLNFEICNFLIGGISTNMQNPKIFEAERRLILKKYFKIRYFLYQIDRFMLKTFKSIYLPLRNIFIK